MHMPDPSSTISSAVSSILKVWAGVDQEIAEGNDEERDVKVVVQVVEKQAIEKCLISCQV